MNRTIYPLTESPAGRDADGNCLCNHCRHWSPLLHNIREQLDEEGRELLNEYVNHSMNESEDASLAYAQLDGSWPGWEFMTKLKEWNRETHRPVITFESIPSGEHPFDL